MSLILYLDKEDVPQGTFLCKENDLFFDGQTLLNDSAICSDILRTIDQATYNSPETFIGRDKDIGALYKVYLSTGCKTLLNIVMHPDICFSLLECGLNAKQFTLGLTTGQALWVPDQLDIEDDTDCDIICGGTHFNKVGDLIEYMDSMR